MSRGNLGSDSKRHCLSSKTNTSADNKEQTKGSNELAEYFRDAGAHITRRREQRQRKHQMRCGNTCECTGDLSPDVDRDITPRQTTPPRQASASVTTGFRCAPEIELRESINAKGAAIVLLVRS